MAVDKSKQVSQPAVTDANDDDDEFFSAEHRVHTQISYPGWVTHKANLDRDVLEFYKSKWPERHINTFNQLLKAYMDGKLKVIIPVKEYSSDRVKVVGKYDPKVVAWIKNMPNSDGFMSLVLRDFMQSCIERGEPKPET